MTRRAAGMTLLELLVALAVFSIIATAAYAGLRDGTRLETRLGTQRAFWQRFEAVHGVLRDDLARVPAVVPDALAAGQFQAASQHGVIESGVWLRLVRDTNLEFRDSPASPYQPVAYAFENGSLFRAIPTSAEADAGSGNSGTPLLEHITALRARYLDQDQRWLDAWPPQRADGQAAGLPRALELNLSVAGYGDFRWVFDVGAAL